jgi:hypothetical protein
MATDKKRKVKAKSEVVMVEPLKPLCLFLIAPMKGFFIWAFVEGQSVIERGDAITAEELVAVSKRLEVADVFIDIGYRTGEALQLAEKNRWHCVKGIAGRKRYGVAELIDQVCSYAAYSGGFCTTKRPEESLYRTSLNSKLSIPEPRSSK